MKIRVDQLAPQLNQHLHKVYLVSGDEPLQVNESCDLIRQRARSAGFTERHLFHVDAQFDWQLFLQTANSLSLFAEKQLLELRMPTGKPGDSGRKALLEYLGHSQENNLLLIITERLDSATQKTKWVKAVEQEGLFIPVWPVEGSKLPGWMARRLKSEGFTAEPEALALLCERVEGNLLAAVQEIEKLKLLACDNKIDLAVVGEAVSDSARYDVFQWVDAVLSGNAAAVVKMLKGLRGESAEPPIVLWALMRDIRLLALLEQSDPHPTAREKACDEAAKALGLSPWLVKKRRSLLEACLRRHQKADLCRMIVHAGEIDRGIKGQQPMDVWGELLSLSLCLAGAKVFPDRYHVGQAD